MFAITFFILQAPAAPKRGRKIAAKDLTADFLMKPEGFPKYIFNSFSYKNIVTYTFLLQFCVFLLLKCTKCKKTEC